jgi:hypothetical protein
MIARGMFRLGLRVSPPSCTACSKPRQAKMTPPDDNARNTPFQPKGMNPPFALKFSPCAEVAMSATTVTTGIRSFQQTASMLASASQRTPRMLIVQKSKSSAAATT